MQVADLDRARVAHPADHARRAGDGRGRRATRTADGDRGAAHGPDHGHAGQVRSARKAVSSAVVGAVAGPRRVAEKAAAALARRAASAGAAPAARAAMKAPAWVSPAPVVSMACTGKPGMWTASPP